MRIAYADPPYPGQSKKHYGDHPDFAGEVDHDLLIADLCSYDGWCLHTSSSALPQIIEAVESLRGAFPIDYRVMAWVKPFAVFKANVPVAYAWEPILVSPCRKPTVGRGILTPLRDWHSASIVLNGGTFAGAKPRELCWWLFEVMGCDSEDELCDLYPGTGAVTEAWRSWRSQLVLGAANSQPRGDA